MELLTENGQVEKYVVAYAKISTVKGISLQGVYFGGIGGTIEEANSMARECVNRVRGGTVMPRVVRIDSKHQVLDALYDATERFEAQTQQMQEAERIISRTQRKS